MPLARSHSHCSNLPLCLPRHNNCTQQLLARTQTLCLRNYLSQRVGSRSLSLSIASSATLSACCKRIVHGVWNASMETCIGFGMRAWKLCLRFPPVRRSLRGRCKSCFQIDQAYSNPVRGTRFVVQWCHACLCRNTSWSTSSSFSPAIRQ
jgi:hypothetical protein